MYEYTSVKIGLKQAVFMYNSEQDLKNVHEKPVFDGGIMQNRYSGQPWMRSVGFVDE